MTTHYEASVQRSIERIRESLRDMSCLAERALEDAGRALLEGNRQLAYAVILRDQYVDAKEKEVDALCLDFLVKQQPVAGLLRFAYSTIKVNLEIEAAGDYAESVARQALKLGALPEGVPTEGLKELAALTPRMLKEATDAFLRQDADRARSVIDMEEKADALKGRLHSDFVHLFQEGKIPFPALNSLMMVVRHLERASDSARDISMETLYVATGQFAKHQGAEEIKVVFIDQHNSCRSRLAEACASAMRVPMMTFTSAGLEPEPVDATTFEFLKDKGVDLSGAAPKALFQVPNLDRVQVIVALDKSVARAFPREPRKVVYLDWDVPDPSRVKGTPEEIRAAYERTYEFICSHVKDLVDAISDTKRC